MPYRVKPAVAIKKLTSQVQAKQAQLQKLEQEREHLVYREALLSSTLQALQTFDHQPLVPAAFQSVVQHGGSSSMPAVLGASCSQQMTAFCSRVGSSSSTSTVQLSNSTIAPPEDPLSLLYLLPSEQQQQADPVTLTQMQKEYQCMVDTLSAHVSYVLDHQRQQQHSGLASGTSTDCCSSARWDQALAIIQQTLRNYWSSMNTALLAGRADITHQFVLSNVSTGEQIEQHIPMLYQSVVEQLQLPTLQQQRILDSLDFFKQIAEPVVAARQQLQLQLGASSAAAAAANPAANGAATVLLRLPPSAAFQSQTAVLQQQERLWQSEHQRQLQLAQLSTLLRKESLLKGYACVCIQGCLTWAQMAQSVLACFPYVLSPIALAQAIGSKQHK